MGSAKPYRVANDPEARIVVGSSPPRARAADFRQLYRELVEEVGRALEEDDLDWCAILQGYLIPKIEAEGLRGQGAWPLGGPRGPSPPKEDPDPLGTR
jgi:hypothetical protein